jgi:hypothetical protein
MIDPGKQVSLDDFLDWAAKDDHVKLRCYSGMPESSWNPVLEARGKGWTLEIIRHYRENRATRKPKKSQLISGIIEANLFSGSHYQGKILMIDSDFDMPPAIEKARAEKRLLTSQEVYKAHLEEGERITYAYYPA